MGFLMQLNDVEQCMRKKQEKRVQKSKKEKEHKRLYDTFVICQEV